MITSVSSPEHQGGRTFLHQRVLGDLAREALEAPLSQACLALGQLLSPSGSASNNVLAVLARRPELVEKLDFWQLSRALGQQRLPVVLALLRALEIQGGDAWDSGLENRFRLLLKGLPAKALEQREVRAMDWIAIEAPDLLGRLDSAGIEALVSADTTSGATQWGIVFWSADRGDDLALLRQRLKDSLAKTQTVDVLWLMMKYPDSAAALLDDDLKAQIVSRLAWDVQSQQAITCRLWLDKDTADTMQQAQGLLGVSLGTIKDAAILLGAVNEPLRLLRALEADSQIVLSEPVYSRLLEILTQSSNGEVRAMAILLLPNLEPKKSLAHSKTTQVVGN